jgi:Family of unknown function (DUF5946)
MNTGSDLLACPGCGGLFQRQNGPVHRYMISSPGCWSAYGAVLAAEYTNPDLLSTHRLSVDTYAAQHPGNDLPAARQSVGLHLARLCIQLSAPTSPKETNDVMLGLGKHKASLPALTAPKAFGITVADVVPFANTSEHSARVRAWAIATWLDWSGQHDVIRTWLESIGSDCRTVRTRGGPA